jgi:GPH family glycoside/pentoside/hexuronide:cation symporter
MTVTALPTSTRPVPFGTLWRYGFGQVGGQLFRDAPATLLPIFMTTMLGVPPWIAGLAIIIPKLWLILCDPLVGALSDRLKVRFGRTPFLVVGAVVTSLGFAILFSLRGFSTPEVAAAAVSVVFLLASTGFSAFSVPYLALASEVSDDAHERSRLLASRIIGAIVGVIAGIGLAQPVIVALGGGADAWRTAGFLLAGLCLVTMLVTALTMHGRAERTATAPETEGLFVHIGHALRQRPFMWLTLTYLLQCTAQGCSFTVVSFVFLYCVGNVNLILPFVLMMSVASLVSQPAWLALARRFGSVTCFVVANIGYIAISISAFWITPGRDVLVTLPVVGALSTEQAIVLVRALPLAFFNSGFLLFILSMFTDVVNRVKDRTGSVNEGVFSGIFTATEKLSFAIAPMIGGIVLSASGFVASTGGAHAQGSRALTGILAMYALIPAAIMVGSLATFWMYWRITRDETA